MLPGGREIQSSPEISQGSHVGFARVDDRGSLVLQVGSILRWQKFPCLVSCKFPSVDQIHKVPKSWCHKEADGSRLLWEEDWSQLRNEGSRAGFKVRFQGSWVATQGFQEFPGFGQSVRYLFLGFHRQASQDPRYFSRVSAEGS